MTLQQLRDFVAVVTHGGYRPAARVLDVAQAGLTKSIARLEQAYGVALLDRHSNVSRLPGRRLCSDCGLPTLAVVLTVTAG